MGITTEWNDSSSAITTDATWTDSVSIAIPEGNVIDVNFTVMARSSTGTVARWELRGLIKRLTDGNIIDVGPGLLSLITPIKETAALLWDVGYHFDNTEHNFVFKTKGIASTTICWNIGGKFHGFYFDA